MTPSPSTDPSEFNCFDTDGSMPWDFLFLRSLLVTTLVRPGAPRSVLAPSSKALVPTSFLLLLVRHLLLVAIVAMHLFLLAVCGNNKGRETKSQPLVGAAPHTVAHLVNAPRRCEVPLQFPEGLREHRDCRNPTICRWFPGPLRAVMLENPW